jgi:hypothetical protein
MPPSRGNLLTRKNGEQLIQGSSIQPDQAGRRPLWIVPGSNTVQRVSKM